VNGSKYTATGEPQRFGWPFRAGFFFILFGLISFRIDPIKERLVSEAGFKSWFQKLVSGVERAKNDGSRKPGHTMGTDSGPASGSCGRNGIPKLV
jgi:hypothetical protein